MRDYQKHHAMPDTIQRIREFNDDEFTLDVSDYADAYAEYYAKQREHIATLLAHLERYGGHAAECAIGVNAIIQGEPFRCTCGWTEINNPTKASVSSKSEGGDARESL